MDPEILAVNPGSTSTKIAWFSGEERRWQVTVDHDPAVISSFPKLADQYKFRMETIEEAARTNGSDLDALGAVVGRGGLLEPIPGGTYRVDEDVLRDLWRGKPWEHASNLGGIIAEAIARPGDPGLHRRPRRRDELDDLSGSRACLNRLEVLGHALGSWRPSDGSPGPGKPWDELDCLVAHLGGAYDRNIATEDGDQQRQRVGPFSPRGREASRG